MKLINYLKAYLYFLIPFLILIFITSLLYYFNIINNNFIKYLKIIIVIISTLLSGYKIGKLSNTKGYLNGMILGFIISFIFLSVSLITNNLKWSLLVYYLIIIITTSLGGILGINKHHL